jgi:hypothetical protein
LDRPLPPAAAVSTNAAVLGLIGTVSESGLFPWNLPDFFLGRLHLCQQLDDPDENVQNVQQHGQRVADHVLVVLLLELGDNDLRVHCDLHTVCIRGA